jgi:hypothetical protein
MRRFAFLAGLLAVGLALLAAVTFDALRSRAPSRGECVALWNAPPNAALRTQVVVHSYTTAEIEGAFVQRRYQGCFANFVEAIGKPWAIYSATRVPGEEPPLRWVLELRGRRWGIDFPEPEPRPESNALVLPDGSLLLEERSDGSRQL